MGVGEGEVLAGRQAEEAIQHPPAPGRPAEGLTANERAMLIKGRKIERLIEHLHRLEQARFTGYIKINYTQGHIGRVEKFEEILKS